MRKKKMRSAADGSRYAEVRRNPRDDPAREAPRVKFCDSGFNKAPQEECNDDCDDRRKPFMANVEPKKLHAWALSPYVEAVLSYAFRTIGTGFFEAKAWRQSHCEAGATCGR